MGLALLAFAALFVLLVSLGLLLFYREAMVQRLTSLISPHSGESSAFRRFPFAEPGESIGAMVRSFERVIPRSPDEVSVIEKRLIRAGYREASTVKVFYGSKFVVPILLCLLVTATGIYDYGAFFVYGTAVALGFLAPDFWLGNRIAARKLALRLGLPDALDLIVICIEAGLSLDQATLRTASELAVSEPAIADELGLVNLEQRAGKPRAEAWKHLAERTDVDAIRALVATVLHADQFGSSISKALRTHSQTLRTQRRQNVEELAAKTAVKLVFPLVLFIFPSLFVVALGPAMIVILESFPKYF
jgi:tight adherence protein C